MLTIDDLKRLEVRPNEPSVSEAEKNCFRRGAEAMRAAIINACVMGRYTAIDRQVKIDDY